MDFQKITKKQFIQDLTSSNVIFLDGFFSSHKLEDFESKLIEICKNIDVNKLEQCRCSMQSNALKRLLPNGETSMLYFDQKASRTFYQFDKVRIMMSSFDNYDKHNYVFYYIV